MSDTWFVFLDPHLAKDGEEPIVIVKGSKSCTQKEGSYYHVVLDGGIEISFETSILRIVNDDDM